MSYLIAVAILLLVISPLLIPLTVSGVHGFRLGVRAVADWRRKNELFGSNLRPQSPALSPAV